MARLDGVLKGPVMEGPCRSEVVTRQRGGARPEKFHDGSWGSAMRDFVQYPEHSNVAPHRQRSQVVLKKCLDLCDTQLGQKSRQQFVQCFQNGRRSVVQRWGGTFDEG